MRSWLARVAGVCVMGCAIALAEGPASTAPGEHPAGSISGRLSGPDASGATVKLNALLFSSTRSWLYTTVAASDGSFRFNAVGPGTYKLSTEGAHHQHSEYGAKGPGLAGMPIVLTAGKQVQGLELKTFAKTSFCGTVFDPAGKPRPATEVTIQGYTGKSHKGSPGTWEKHALTDAQGRFKITDAGPADLQLWAQVGPERTYFPSAADEYHQAWLWAGSESSTCSFNIYLRSADGKSFKSGVSVAGTIQGKLDPAVGDHFYADLYQETKQATPYVEPVEIQSNGAFEVKGVWPGKYTLRLRARYGEEVNICPQIDCIDMGYRYHTLALQEITVADHDLENLTLSVGTLPTLDGQILYDGKEPEKTDPYLHLFADFGTHTSAPVEADGHFSFKTVEAETYSFSPDGTPPGYSESTGRLQTPYYIQSALLNGRPVEGRQVELHLGESAHLVIQMVSGTASGSLTSMPRPLRSHQRQFSRTRFIDYGSGRTNLMIPDPLPEDNTGIIETWQRDDEDSHVSSVPPGSYRILAVDNFALPNYYLGRMLGTQTVTFTRHDAWVRLAAFGTAVEIHPNQEFHLTAPLVTVQMRQIMAQMGLPATD